MTPEQLPNNPPVLENVPASTPVNGASRIGLLPSLGILLLELILPVTLAGLFLYWLSGAIRLWRLNQTLALIIFAVIFVVVNLVVCVVLDGFTLSLRKRSTVKKFINPVSPRARWVKYIVNGILIPVGVFAAANLLVFPQGGTPMTFVVQSSQLLVKTSPVAKIGDAVLSSTGPATKIQGIKTLQAVHSPDSLDQLFRILTTDPAALSDAGVYETLSSAIASYGTEAKGGLLDLYKNSDQSKVQTGGGAGQDTFSWYFSVPFDELRKEIQAQIPDQTSLNTELSRLDSAETALKQSLAAMQVAIQAPLSSASMLDFILQTFLAVEVKQDKEILQFAKTIASDNGFPNGPRGQALILMAKLGGEDELNLLYTYLDSNDEFIKAKALEAIANLQFKVPINDSSK